jgi:transposase-like protein
MFIWTTQNTKARKKLQAAVATDILRRLTLREASYKGEFGHATLEIPRDRNGEFEPQIIKKGQTRFDSFDGKILSLYGRGMTTRDIQAQLKDMYDVEGSATLISEVTDAVIDEVKTWQARSLAAVYPLMWLDVIVVKVRENGRMALRKVTQNHRVFPNDEAVLKVIYLAIGNVSQKWTMPIREWKPALNRFAIQFEGRFPKEILL